MKVLSLFDGMSCGQLALDRANIRVDKYYASEIDKYAIKVAKENYPDTAHLGDVENWKEWDIPWEEIGLVLAGSPCQGFSFAGKQLAFDDPRSKLFFTFCEILEHIKSLNPVVYFLLENVKMKKDYLDIISNRLGVEPVFIDSKLVSAQMRQRYYWTNWDFSEPEDKELMFQDVLESGEARVPKAFALTRTYYKGGGEVTRQRNFYKSQRPIAWISDNETRHLSPTECERLQTVPEGYTSSVSKTQRLMMLGNGWTVDVIVHILRSNCE